MDCKGYHELITGAVDRELSSSEESFLAEHLKGCSRCRSDHELEVSFKALVGARMQPVATPAHVLRAISESISDESAEPRRSFIEGLREFIERPFVRPALAGALTIVIALMLITGRTAKDVIEESVAQYEAVVSGETPMQFASSEPAVLREFFNGKTQFPVIIPQMEDCTLLGGILEENPDGAVAEVLYNHFAQKIYLYQTGWDAVESGAGHSVTPEVRAALLRDNSFTYMTAEGHTVVLWKNGPTLCSAVSDMSSEDLKQCLTSGDPDLLRKP